MSGDSQMRIAGREERVFAVSQELTPVEIHIGCAAAGYPTPSSAASPRNPEDR